MFWGKIKKQLSGISGQFEKKAVYGLNFFAELQAINRRTMYMKDWVIKLDDFLRLSEREILSHAGKISHQRAIEKAHTEYDKYHASMADDPSSVEKHFIEAVQSVKQLEVEVTRKKNKKE